MLIPTFCSDKDNISVNFKYGMAICLIVISPTVTGDIKFAVCFSVCLCVRDKSPPKLLTDLADILHRDGGLFHTLSCILVVIAPGEAKMSFWATV